MKKLLSAFGLFTAFFLPSFLVSCDEISATNQTGATDKKTVLETSVTNIGLQQTENTTTTDKNAKENNPKEENDPDLEKLQKKFNGKWCIQTVCEEGIEATAVTFFVESKSKLVVTIDKNNPHEESYGSLLSPQYCKITCTYFDENQIKLSGKCQEDDYSESFSYSLKKKDENCFENCDQAISICKNKCYLDYHQD